MQQKNAAQSSEEQKLNPPLFYNLPKAYQDQQSSIEKVDSCLGCPSGYFAKNHPTTLWFMSLVSDDSEWRLRRALLTEPTRHLFSTGRYFQLLDNPALYLGKGGDLERSLFSRHSVLYLNPLAVTLYLKLDIAASVLSSPEYRRVCRFTNSAIQYATHLGTDDKDLACYQLDYLCIKRQFYQGLQYLAAVKWNPNDSTVLTYRRPHYQFSVPFTDWMDLTRYLLDQRPSMNLGLLMKEMYHLQYSVAQMYGFSMTNMKQFGSIMMEAFELREIKPEHNCASGEPGMYVGRKLLRDKTTLVPEEFSDPFKDSTGQTYRPLRPVVQNVLSYPRRLLTYLYYFDNKTMRALPQVLRALRYCHDQQFFNLASGVKAAVQTDTTGSHKVYLDPLIFQIRYFLDIGSRGQLLRHKVWPNVTANFTISGLSDLELAWTYRFDALNCVSLLAGLLQNCLIRQMGSNTVDQLCELIVHILVSSDLIECFLRYSFYDVYFGLTSVVNCVPNLMSKTVMRLLKKAPITLTDFYSVPKLSTTFTIAFWQTDNALPQSTIIPSTSDEMGDFLVIKKRRLSMKIEGPVTSERMSGASSMGASGNVTLFYRNYSSMPEIAFDDEIVESTSTETTKKQDEERLHVMEYKQTEVDARYSRVFPFYFSKLGKAEIVLDEDKTYSECVQASRRKTSLYYVQHN